MFKYSKDLVPLPIVELFARNYEFHNHNTRQSQSLHTAVGRNKAYHLHFMALEFGITYLQKYQKMFYMPVLNILQNHLSKITKYHIE